MEVIKITKKELKERGSQQSFTGRGVKINCFWFDWQQGEYKEDGIAKIFVGYKFMVAGYNLTKKQVFDHMHYWLTNGYIGHNPNIKIWTAETDKQRKKCPLQFNWNNW